MIILASAISNGFLSGSDVTERGNVNQLALILCVYIVNSSIVRYFAGSWIIVWIMYFYGLPSLEYFYSNPLYIEVEYFRTIVNIYVGLLFGEAKAW